MQIYGIDLAMEKFDVNFIEGHSQLVKTNENF